MLLHLGVIGATGAVIGAAIMLCTMLALVYVFARSVWPLLEQGNGGAQAAARGSD